MSDTRALSFGDLVAPVPAHAFLNEWVGKKPIHLAAPANSDRKLLDWERFNELLDISSHWTDAYLRLVINGMPVSKDRYCDQAQSLYGHVWRADPAKVQAFVAMGASLVANMVDEVSPELRSVAETIGQSMGGVVTANIYASFRNIGGFGPHYDASDVLAFHCAGEKVWRFYEGRADNPLKVMSGPEHLVHEQLREAAGQQVSEVVMQPGDALYIPRGWYHDAMTRSDSSLHVSFAIMPLTGRVLLRVLDQVTMEESAFREYVPNALLNDNAFRTHIMRLADRLRDLALSPQVLGEIRRYHQDLRKPVTDYALPARQPVRAYRVTRTFSVAPGDPPVVHISGGGMLAVPHVAEAAAWVATAPAVSNLEIYARFRALGRSDLDSMLEGLVKLGALTAI